MSNCCVENQGKNKPYDVPSIVSSGPRRTVSWPKVVVIGQAAVGKSSLIRKYRVNDFSEDGLQPTTGSVVFTEEFSVAHEPGKPFKVMLWDTAGEERYAPLLKSFYRQAAVGIFVYSIVDEKSVQALPKWTKAFCEVAPYNAHMLFVGNKSDLTSKIDSKQLDHVLTKLIDRTEAGQHIRCNSVSARTGDGVQQLFSTAAQLAFNYRHPNKPWTSIGVKNKRISSRRSLKEKSNVKSSTPSFPHEKIEGDSK
eukprot:g1501.t1